MIINVNESNLIFEISKNKKLGYIDNNGELIKLTKEKASLHVANYQGAIKEDTLVAFEEEGKFGFKTLFGEVLIEAKFDSVMGSFNEGFGIVGKHIGTWYYKQMPRKTYFMGYIDCNGQTVIDYKYINAFPFYNGVALVQEPNPNNIHSCYSSDVPRWSLIDKTGKPVVNTKFQWASNFSEGLAAVKLNDKYGFINTKGELVIEPKFDMVTSFKSGISRVAIKDEAISKTFVDKNWETGHITISPNFKGKFGMINTNGDFVFEPEIAAPTLHFNSEYFDFHEDLCRIEKEGKYGFINIKGKEVIPTIYDDAGFFSEGLVSVVLNGKCGYVNQEGTFIIEPQFIYGWEFREGLAPIQKRVSIIDNKTGKKKYRQKWGFINKQGEIIIDPTYTSVSGFYDGLAMVNFDKGMGYINS
ncbi:WG repeat-containing protein, partial [Winogradskyella sp.]|uniref:WG repeat-containing protein n=1 Tax=Winogradskyella sp. TaxID=1883156 RepID=UPI001B02A017